MFARIAEWKMLVVRAFLLFGWLVLIASLFWDPLTSRLTEPDNLISPFHIKAATYPLRGTDLAVVPYHMSNRIFWAMVVPILPIFLMVFGHEAWRRICPLSFASQLPRYLGIQRKRMTLHRRTGKVERVTALIARNSWLHRNSWYVQFGLLYTGLCLRLLFLNSDRLALAVAMIVVIAGAVITGYLWGGKTWCNYICPANIVQRIYTEPRGLLESAPQFGRPPIPQSMCRTSTRGNEKSACVGCMTGCGDIDLERSYWESIEDPTKRNVYYMFFGLIVGFYGYYFLYAGNWDYYFSGFWTHEAGQIASIFDSGLMIGTWMIPIPKLLAVPLVFAAAVLTSLCMFKLVEAIYREIRRSESQISEAEIINHCLAFSAFVSINIFYLFGGRPNLLLLPPVVLSGIQVLILFASTLWLWQAIQRSPIKYRRESLAAGLIVELKKSTIDIREHFDGRSLEQLKPDEIYLLAKVLPAFSHEAKLDAYNKLLDEAITTGKTSSPQFSEILGDMRTKLGISEEEHTHVLASLGIVGEPGVDVRMATSSERAGAFANYNELVGTAIANQIELGRALDEAVGLPEIKATIHVLRASFQITELEHVAMLQRLIGPGGFLMARLKECFDGLVDLHAARFCLRASSAPEKPVSGVAARAVDGVDMRILAEDRRFLSILRALTGCSEAKWYAACLVGLQGGELSSVLAEPVHADAPTRWQDALDRELVVILLGKVAGRDHLGQAPAGARLVTYRDVIKVGLDLGHNLQTLTPMDDPVLTAIALAVFSDRDHELAFGFAQDALMQDRTAHWLLAEVLDDIALGRRRQSPASGEVGLRVTLQIPKSPPQIMTFFGTKVTIGREPGNDVEIKDRLLAPRHLVVSRDGSDIRVQRLHETPLYINGTPCEGELVSIGSAGHIDFAYPPGSGPAMVLDGTSQHGGYDRANDNAVTRLAWMSRNKTFRRLGLPALAVTARHAVVRVHASGDHLCQQGDPLEHIFFIRSGSVEVVTLGADQASEIHTLGADDTYGLESFATQDSYAASLRVASEIAVVIVIRSDAMSDGRG